MAYTWNFITFKATISLRKMSETIHRLANNLVFSNFQSKINRLSEKFLVRNGMLCYFHILTQSIGRLITNNVMFLLICTEIILFADKDFTNFFL